VTEPIPLLVIGGFLGAGKTTLLNHLLSQSRGLKLAVLVNDFGSVNIDAALIESAKQDVVALTNGCVCCSIGDDLSQALSQILDHTPRFDGIVIEASGVSDPWRIAQIGLAEPDLRLACIVVMIDATTYLTHASDPLLANSVLNPLKHADWVLLNKIDLVHTAFLDQIADQLPKASHVTWTENAKVDLLPLLLHHSTQVSSATPVTPDHSDLFDSLSFKPSDQLSLNHLRQIVGQLPTDLLRLKGWLLTAEGAVEIQYAGRQGSLKRLKTQPPSEPSIVAISLKGKLPRLALKTLFG
jgi:G3E family GTPase